MCCWWWGRWYSLEIGISADDWPIGAVGRLGWFWWVMSPTASRHGLLSRPGSAGVVVGETDSVALLFDAVSSVDATDVLLLDLTAFSAAFPEPITALARLGVGLHQRVSAAETLMGLRTIGEVGGVPITRLKPHALAGHQVRLKRLMDLTLVIAAAPIWVPTVGLVALYVQVVAGAPVLYHQTRVGLDGAPFELHKFRTMMRDAEAE